VVIGTQKQTGRVILIEKVGSAEENILNHQQKKKGKTSREGNWLECTLDEREDGKVKSEGSPRFERRGRGGCAGDLVKVIIQRGMMLDRGLPRHETR